MDNNKLQTRTQRALILMAVATVIYGVIAYVRPSWRYGWLMPLAVTWLFASDYAESQKGLSVGMSLGQIHEASRRSDVRRPTLMQRAMLLASFCLFAVAVYFGFTHV